MKYLRQDWRVQWDWRWPPRKAQVHLLRKHWMEIRRGRAMALVHLSDLVSVPAPWSSLLKALLRSCAQHQGNKHHLLIWEAGSCSSPPPFVLPELPLHAPSLQFPASWGSSSWWGTGITIATHWFEIQQESAACVSQRAGMNMPGKGERRGPGSRSTSQSREPKISSGNWNVRAPGNHSCEKKARDKEGKCTPPTPTTNDSLTLSAPGSPQLLTHPHNISG